MEFSVKGKTAKIFNVCDMLNGCLSGCNFKTLIDY